jgi:hypothetical protein
MLLQLIFDLLYKISKANPGEMTTTSVNEDPNASGATPTTLPVVRSATSPVIPRMNPCEEPSRNTPVDSSPQRPRVLDADSVIGNVGRSYFAQLAASQVKASTLKMYKTVFLSFSSNVSVKS